MLNYKLVHTHFCMAVIRQMVSFRSLLEKRFKDWVGELEQVDDVTVIGIRI